MAPLTATVLVPMCRRQEAELELHISRVAADSVCRILITTLLLPGAKPFLLKKSVCTLKNQLNRSTK